MYLLMYDVTPTRLMCMLFSDDLTVTDTIPLCSLPTRSPQESEFQETASDRSDGRETEDGGLSGTGNNRSFLLFPFHSLFHLQLVHWQAQIWKWKKKSSGRPLLRKNSFDFYVERNIFVKRVAVRVSEWSGSHSCARDVSACHCEGIFVPQLVSLWVIGGPCLSVVNSDTERRTFFVYHFVCARTCVCLSVFSLTCQDVWEELSAGGYLGDQSWGKALREVEATNG